MRLFKPSKKVVFVNDELERAFNSLTEGSPLKKAIRKAISDLKENAFCGERIKKELIPKEYISNHEIDNLWWYSLSGAWRLVYSLSSEQNIGIVAVIIEYFDSHKDYERRFGYK